jgi:hypothetical protein
MIGASALYNLPPCRAARNGSGGSLTPPSSYDRRHHTPFVLARMGGAWGIGIAGFVGSSPSPASRSPLYPAGRGL